MRLPKFIQRNHHKRTNSSSKQLLSGVLLLLASLIIITLAIWPQPQVQANPENNNKAYLPVVQNPLGGAAAYPIVFVSRQIPNQGSIYWNTPKGMPGVGPWSRFQVASPGKLLVREPNGTIRTLIDGANPTAASRHLVDVSSPSVSYDGTKIAFAGFPQQAYNSNATQPQRNPGAWRIYTINVDGTNLQQVTTSDFSYNNLNMTQFGQAAGAFSGYDDTDPTWLPDGRLVFSSTRWPSQAQYSGVRATNLYVVNANGTGMRRITSERNGADRPLVDPLTGKIVYSRWWRNHRFATNNMATVTGGGGYQMHLGLTTDRSNHVGGADNLWRNEWFPAAINPDGTELVLWSGNYQGHDYYGGAFTDDGVLIGNYFPMTNMTEAGGFGGLRRIVRGAGNPQGIIGITGTSGTLVNNNPPSYGIYVGNYAAEPDVAPNGTILFSWAEGISQDYGLYTINANGQNRTLLYNNPGTTELQARIIRPRPLPPIIPDTVTQIPPLLPPPAQGPYNTDGTFVFDARNVYFNAPVDWPIVNAPPVGSAATISFFLDHQRTSPGSFPALDWPILLGTKNINPNGSVIDNAAPANLPLFEIVRSANGNVPLTRDPYGVNGAAHVAGMNFGRPGTTATCVGCHAGHTLIPLPADPQWTNLATGATVRVSSTNNSQYNKGVNDRMVMRGEIWRYWISANGQTQNQWVELVFPVPVTVRTVTLYNPRQGGEANSTLQVGSTRVRLYSDVNATNQLATQTSGSLSVSGTNVNFNDVTGVRVVRVEITSMSGTFYGMQVASIAEIEVIARGEALTPADYVEPEEFEE
ncbi:MAG: PD40 domain-containing protein [Anaerolineae bacterium]|nr:PD40 domain-containing protein [Anaerolineae bacterium]